MGHKLKGQSISHGRFELKQELQLTCRLRTSRLRAAEICEILNPMKRIFTAFDLRLTGLWLLSGHGSFAV
jgi:hypothetical protein